MGDLNPRKVALYTLSKRAPSATRRILRRESYPTRKAMETTISLRRALPYPARLSKDPSRGVIL